MAMDRGETVVGVFPTRPMAEHAIEQLKNNGFTDDQIGFAVRNAEGSNTNTLNQAADTQATGDTGGGAVAGAVGGGILGGILGAAASLLIPGFGPVIAGGILAATLGGAAIGAAAGGIIGALTQMGVPEEEARYYQGEFEAGRTIVTVNAGDRAQAAEDILRRNGAYDASTRGANATTQAGAYAGNNDYSTYDATNRSNMEETDQMAANNFNQQHQQGQRASSGNWRDISPTYRDYWQQRYGNQGGQWADYEPVYQYGWEMRNNPRYSNLSWDQAEPQLRRDWQNRNSNISWDQASPLIAETWNNDFSSYGTQGYDTTGESRSVPIREEQLQATKQPVQTGEVQIGKEVITEEKTINVPVQREEVVIERRNFAPQAADQPIDDQGETIRIPVSEEQVSVQKTPVVTGEVRVGKQVVQDNQQVSDTVRREEAHIERQGDINVRDSGVDQSQYDQTDTQA